MHRLGIAVALVIAGAGVGYAKNYTHAQHDGPEKEHVTKLAFTPLAAWKERLDKHADLPTFVDAKGDVVALLTDISVFGKTAAEHLDSGVRSMFLDSKDASKIARTDRGKGRWWVVDRNASFAGRPIHADLFVPDGDHFFAVCDVRLPDDSQLAALAKVCDTLAVTASEDRKASPPTE